MPKYLSGRVKRTPQDKLSDDRYRYLDLSQAEPNIGDPPTASGTPGIPAGQQYQMVSVLSNPGERYWVPVGGGLIPGSISVYDEGSLVGSVSSITQLNFVGNAIEADAVLLGTISTITVSPPGNNGSVLYKDSGDFATSSDLIFNGTVGILTVGKGLEVGDTGLKVGVGGTFVTVSSSTGLVGIATTNPTQELDVNGDVRIRGTIYDWNNDPGAQSDILTKGATGLEWTSNNSVRTGAGGTIYDVQYHNTAGLVDGAPNFVYRSDTSRVGIGSTQPTCLLDVVGISKLRGGVFIDEPYITGVSTFTGQIKATNGIVANTARVSDLTETRVVFSGQGGELVDDADFTYTTTTDTLNISNLIGSGNAGIGSLNVSGISTLGNIEVGVNSITTKSGALILNGDSGIVQSNAGIFVNVTTDSTTKDTGALVVKGGVGIGSNLNVELQLNVGGATTLASAGGITTTGGDLYVGNDLYVKGEFFQEQGSFQRLLVNPGVSTFKGDVEFWGDSGAGAAKSAYWDKSTHSLNFINNSKLHFGNSKELTIYNNGYTGHSYITESAGSGNLYIQSTAMHFQNATGNKEYAIFNDGDSVDLYHNNLKKFSTVSTGATVYGQIEAQSGKITGSLRVDGGSNLNGHVALGDSTTDNIVFEGKVNSHILPNADSNFNLGSSDLRWSTIYADTFDGITNLTLEGLVVTGIATFKNDVEFWGDDGNAGTAKSAYWDKSDRSFKFVDDAKLILGGDANNLKLYHSDDGNSYIQQHINVGVSTIFISAVSDIVLRQGSSEAFFIGRQNGPAELYYNATKTVETFNNTTDGNKTQGISVFGDGLVGGGVSFVSANTNHYMNVRALAGLSSNYTLTLPPNDGSSGDLLKSDGAGNLDWIQQSDVAGSPGGDDTQIQYNNNNAFGGASYFTYTDSGTNEGDVNFVGVNTSIHWDKSDDKLRFLNGSKLVFGSVGVGSEGLRIWNGINSSSSNTTFIDGSFTKGQFNIQGGEQGLFLQGKAGNDSVSCIPEAEVQIYFNNDKKFETTTNGIKITGGIEDRDNTVGSAGSILSSTGSQLEWISSPSGSLTTIDVKLDNYCGVDDSSLNPISVTPTSAGITTIGIGTTSNAYGRRFVQSDDPTTSAGGNHTVCDGDIWYDTST